MTDVTALPGGSTARRTTQDAATTQGAAASDRRVRVPFLGFVGRDRAGRTKSDGGSLSRERWPEVPGRPDILALASLALRYPDEWLEARAGDLRDMAGALPDSAAANELREFTAWFAAQDGETLRQSYVETFDMRRKTSLHLTYFHHGDTRRRGMALVALIAQLRAAGRAVGEGELADYLPALLEFAATEGPENGERPLRQHRAGIELLYQALVEADSPYSHVLAAVRAVVGELSASGKTQVADLLAAGPPAEEVGLAPFGADHPALPPSPELLGAGADSTHPGGTR